MVATSKASNLGRGEDGCEGVCARIAEVETMRAAIVICRSMVCPSRGEIRLSGFHLTPNGVVIG